MSPEDDEPTSGWGPANFGQGWTHNTGGDFTTDGLQFVAIVEPDQVDRITAAADTAGVADLVTIVGSPVCPAGQIMLIDIGAMEAEFRASMQRQYSTLFRWPVTPE